MNGLQATETLLRRSQIGLRRIAFVQNTNAQAPTSPTPPNFHTRLSSLQSRRPATTARNGAARICQRCFSQSAAANGKKNKSKVHAADMNNNGPTASRAADSSSTSSSSKHPKADVADPFNYADVEAAFARIDEFHEDKLKRLRLGERFNPAVIGRVPVRIDKKTNDTVPLTELALVMPPQGRMVEIRMHEASSKKPIMSAIQASPDFNQQPQPDADNELVLRLKIEPEKVDVQLNRAKEACNAWREQLRDVTRKRSKTHASWKKDGLVRKDDYHKLDIELKKLQDQKMAKIDEIAKETLKKIQAANKGIF